MKHKLWNNKEYKLNSSDLMEGNIVLPEQILAKYFNKFWKDIISEIKDDQHILFIPRLILIDNQYISCRT